MSVAGRQSSSSERARHLALPKAELHCHIEGAASPALVLAQAERYGIDLAGTVENDHFVWNDFSSFLAAYDRAASLFRTEDDYARLAGDHLARLAAQGAIYCEFFISPDHARQAGLEPAAYVKGLSEGIRRAEAEHGIMARMIVVGVRHLGAEAVEASARFAAGFGQSLVTGFGLAGDERAGRASDFARAFDIARAAGLGLTTHAGEVCGAESVRESLDALKPSRLGHGVRAVEDPDLVKRIAAEGIVLEVCPNSNLALSVYPDAASHPLRRLHDAGVRVTLNSDDPPYFRTSLQAEYDMAREHQGFVEAELLGLTRNAVEAAFIDPESRGRLLDRMVRSAISLGAPAGRA